MFNKLGLTGAVSLISLLPIIGCSENKYKPYEHFDQTIQKEQEKVEEEKEQSASASPVYLNYNPVVYERKLKPKEITNERLAYSEPSDIRLINEAFEIAEDMESKLDAAVDPYEIDLDWDRGIILKREINEFPWERKSSRRLETEVGVHGFGDEHQAGLYFERKW